MKKAARINRYHLFLVIFMVIFAMPFVGANLILDEDRETKVIGGILCVIGLAIWFGFAIR